MFRWCWRVFMRVLGCLDGVGGCLRDSKKWFKLVLGG